MQKTFHVGVEPRISLGNVAGDLQARGWDREEIRVDWDGREQDIHQEGDVLILANCRSDIELLVPRDTEIRVEQRLGGKVEIQGVRRVELKNIGGDVELEDIGENANLENSSEAILITDMGGDLNIKNASSVRVYKKVSGDASLESIALVEIEAVSGDLDVHEVGSISVGVVGGDLDAAGLGENLRGGSIGGDCQIQDSSQARINLGNIGGDLEITGAIQVDLGNVSGSSEIRDVQESVRVGNVGGEAELHGVGGDVSLGRVGGDAELHGLAGSIRVGGIGGDLDLQAAFGIESHAHLQVGGDIRIILPEPANLSLQATVGGSVEGPAVSFGGRGNLVRLVYGTGAAQINLSAGGDLELQGGGSPQISSANMPWGEFGHEMGEFGREMGELGRQMGNLGQELSSELGALFTGAGTSWARDMTQKWEEQARKHARKAEESVRHAQERARRASERASQRAGRAAEQIYVRVNEREWRMNPERLNDLVTRAQKAAMEGVAGALEAVEHAVDNLYPTGRSDQAARGRAQTPPTPPMQPMPPMPPMSPMQPMQPMPPMPPMPPFPGVGSSVPPTVQTNEENSPASEERQPDLEQEREAILRMIAEGRITPEEGDMLLEGLGG